MQLPTNEIHLWFLSIEQTQTVDAERYIVLLNAAEQHQYQRYSFAKDRTCYLYSRALLRTVLSSYHPEVTPAAWCFASNTHGKPHIVNDVGPLTFNLSHAKDVIVLAVGSHPLGIDIENTQRAVDALAIAKRYFTQTEYTLLQQQPSLFYRIWTLKEAYVKAKGVGLAQRLQDIAFTFAAQQIQYHLAEPEYSWQFWQIALNQDYMISVAVNTETLRHTPTLRMHSIIPSVQTQLLDLPILAASHSVT